MWNSGKLAEAKKAIIDQSPRAGVSYRLIAFNYSAKDMTGGFVSFPDLVTALNSLDRYRGTALPEALSKASGTVILLTDGMPTYDLDRCFYGSEAELSRITNFTDPNACINCRLKGLYEDTYEPHGKAPDSAKCDTRVHGKPLYDTVQAARGKTIHAIEVKAGVLSNSALMTTIGNGSYDVPTNLSN